MTSDEIAPEILAYYARDPETARLSASASGQLEFVRTMEIVDRHLPAPSATVLDVGGGTGAYALPLARRGYAVHLVDPVAAQVEMAREASAAQGEAPLASASVGDARALEAADGSADAVLLLGPLYHLTDRGERLRALWEARRVLRSGGVLFAVGVSRFASLFAGLYYEQLDDPDMVAIVEQDLVDGQHRNPTERPYWTTAYFHHPDELRAEVAEAGFAIEEVAGVECVEFVVKDLAAWWDDPTRRERLLWTARAIEHEPTVLGLSSHVMVVGRRP